ncbi:outer membrane protein assembly factor BamE [Pseudoduganella sp. DS3]|uniref:Outer membrane protein assembly factor BamE n=1 Tax=Pseudoduganella guangdongensis TaxID=2692179 RepID=A0A6N9HAT5_9BURK|nr:outer membrane protein assembly factor BamE [Pseudoduganella guangdongensis]
MRSTPLSLLQRSTPLLAAALLAACASKPATVTPVEASQGAQTSTITQVQKFLWFFSPYRPDIQQGNFVSQEMLAQLKTGMGKDQVKFLLGTPLMADPFHAQRWDYPFRLAKGNGELTTSTVVVYFDKDDKVARFEGGNLPTEQEYIARIAGPIKDFKRAENAKGNAAPGKAPLPGGQESGQKQ